MFNDTTNDAVDEIAEFLGVAADRKPAVRALLESSEKPITLDDLKAAIEANEALMK